MKNSEYWRERFVQLEEAQNKKGVGAYEEIESIYSNAIQEIDGKIAAWYQRFADNNEISMAEARQWLTGKDLKEFKWSVEEYIKYGERNETGHWSKQLENASARVHISKLEALKIHTRQSLEVLAAEYNGVVTSAMSDIYETGYYHTAYEIQKGMGAGWDISSIAQNQIDKVISKPWAVDGKNFSERIWGEKQKLINTIHKELSQGVLMGQSPMKTIDAVSKTMQTSKRNAGRLVMTEEAYFSSAAQQDCFNDLDVEKYEILATLDYITSEICQEMDGKVFDMKDYEPGVTAHPFHVNCRTTTVPYFDDEFTEGEERAARDADGNTYYVPADMKYPEWHKEFVESNPKELLAEKMAKNEYSDQKQYENYKDILGDEYLPKSFSEFQKVKHADPEEYGILKAQAKGMTYYNKAVTNEPEITEHVKAVAEKSGMNTAGMEHRIKEKDSYLRKIRSNYDSSGNTYEVNDIIRYTYTAPSEKLAESTLQAIETNRNMGYNTTKARNYWLDGANPYNGINTTIKAPNGQKFEIQYHTPESFDIKNGEMHVLYKKWDAIQDNSDPEKIKLLDEMFKLSDATELPKNIKEVK